MRLAHVVLSLLSAAAPFANADRVADPHAGTPPPPTSLQRSPTDFSEEYACAVAIMGPRAQIGTGFGKLMRRETENVMLMPVARGHDYGFYLVTANKGAKFYQLDRDRGTALFKGDSERMWSLVLTDEENNQPFGISASGMSGNLTLYDITAEKMDKPEFKDSAYAPTGKTAMNSDAQKDVVSNIIQSLAALPNRLTGAAFETVSMDEKERDLVKTHVAGVLCTCRSLRSSPELIAALDAFKKNLSIAPYTTEDCSPTAAPRATGVRTF